MGEHVIASIPAGRHVLLVARLHVGAGSRAAGRSVADFQAGTEGRVLSLTAGGERHWCPPGEEPLPAGEELTVVVTRQGLAEALAEVEASQRVEPAGSPE